MINKREKSQAILDFVLLFGVLLVFVVGLVRIWIWFNANYARRNNNYQLERMIAGKANDTTAGIYLEVPLELTDDWVFEGRPSGIILR
jgi:cytoskeletal protein RodZ